MLRKAKAGKTSETQKRKTVKASPELPSRRRSSRLSSGHTSETADVIIVDDESCDVGKSKGTMKKTVKSKSLKKNADKCTPVKTAIGMTPQKPAREKTPKAKTSQKGNILFQYIHIFKQNSTFVGLSWRQQYEIWPMVISLINSGKSVLKFVWHIIH